MIKIGNNELKERYISGANGNISEVKKVYDGNHLVHLHLKDNTAFTKRTTCNGNIGEGTDVTAEINSIKGRTVVWNQLFDYNVGYVSYRGNIVISNDILTYTVTEVNSLQGICFHPIPAVENHKYYLSVNANTTETVMLRQRVDATPAFAMELPTDGWVRSSYIINYNSTEDLTLSFRMYNTAIDTTFQIDRRILWVDLTQMFGAGNEPSTVEEFEAMFPEDYYPYSEPKLLSFTGKELKSTWDSEEHTASFDLSTIVDGEGNQVFPDGLRSAGNVYDEIKVENGVTKAIKRIGSVDLGTVIWGYRTTGPGTSVAPFFTGDLHNKKHLSAAISTIYKHISWSNFSTLGSDMSMDTSWAIGSTYINIRNNSYTGSQSFKSAMSGVILYYELATPEEYIIEDISLPQTYLANGLGTEEIISDSTDSPATSPANMDIEYRLVDKTGYGIKWTMKEDAWVSPIRIGNLYMHKTLPIQNKMRRCLLDNSGNVLKYLSDNDTDLATDGTTFTYDDVNYPVMVEIPEYWFEATNDDGECVLKLYPNPVPNATYSRKYYIGAFEAAEIDGVLQSISGMTSYNNDGEYDASVDFNLDAPDTLKLATWLGGNKSEPTGAGVTSRRGKPRTSATIVNFRTYAAARGNKWSAINYEARCSVMRLYFVEYCNFNSQASFNDTLTQEGYRQGGLSAGVTNVAYSLWNTNFNCNPIVPCGVTKNLGNKTGVVRLTYPAGILNTNTITLWVPSYRGIENPFGHIWEITDGIAIYGDTENSKAFIYIADKSTVDNASYITPSGSNAAPIGYHSITDAAPYNTTSSGIGQGYIKVWYWDKNGMFVPLKNGGNRTTIGLNDYYYLYSSSSVWGMLLASGRANNSADAGLGYFNGANGFGISTADIGSRLQYTPKNNRYN